MAEEIEADEPSCPSAAELAAFLCDSLPPTAMDAIGAHISGCRACDAAVRRMDEATSAFRLPRSHPQRDTVTDLGNSEHRRMVAAAQTLSPTQVLPPAAPLTVPPPSKLGYYQ